ncbi:unnamed protein product [Brassica rapa subsp. trilocularis]
MKGRVNILLIKKRRTKKSIIKKKRSFGGMLLLSLCLGHYIPCSRYRVKRKRAPKSGMGMVKRELPSSRDNLEFSRIQCIFSTT